MKFIASALISFVLLLPAACGTLEVSVARTPTPDLGATATVGALQAQNTQLAAQVATLNPASAALSMSSSSETIRRKMQESTRFWKTMFVDGTITWYAPGGTPAPAQAFHEQDWIDYASHRYRVLLGPADGAADTFKACDGTTILEIDLKTGQSQARPLPGFAQETSPAPGQDMLWGQIGTPLTEIALSANYATSTGASGGLFTPLRIEQVAERQTLVADWTRAGDNQHAFRAWVDVETGVILKFQEFGKGGGEVLQGERVVNQIIYDPVLPESLFVAPASPPQFGDASGSPLGTAEPAPTASALLDPLGEVYFFIFDHNYGHETTKLVRLPGSCATGESACPAPAEIPTPMVFNFSLTPLVWSPDGRLAAYAYPTSQNGNKTALSLFDPVHKTWSTLTEFNFIDPPMWSPDGNWLGFRVQDGQGGEDIYAIRRDGTGLTKLSAEQKLPAGQQPYGLEGWSAQGAILHAADGHAYEVDPASGAVAPLTQVLGGKSPWIPSPDGKRLAYVEYSQDNPKRVLRSMGVDGSDVHDLAAFQGGSIYPVIWSRDGTKVAFVRYVDPPESQDVYVVHTDGSGLSQVYHSMTVETIAFSPNGADLMIQDQQVAGQHIYIVNLTSLEQRMIQAPDLPLDWWWRAPSWQP